MAKKRTAKTAAEKPFVENGERLKALFAERGTTVSALAAATCGDYAVATRKSQLYEFTRGVAAPSQSDFVSLGAALGVAASVVQKAWEGKEETLFPTTPVTFDQMTGDQRSPMVATVTIVVPELGVRVELDVPYVQALRAFATEGVESVKDGVDFSVQGSFPEDAKLGVRDVLALLAGR